MQTDLTSEIPNFRLLRKVICWVTIALILVIAGISAWKSFSEYRLTVSAAEQKGRSYARVLREHAERAFGEADSLLQEVRSHVDTHGSITAETSEHLQSLVREHKRSIPQIGAIILVNKEGLLFAHSLEGVPRQANVADREYFLHHRNNPADDTPFLSRPIKSRINGKWRFTLSRPMHSPDGSFDGLVAVAFEMEYFTSFYSSLELGTSGKIVMIRTDGVPIMMAPFNDADFSKDFKQSHLFRKYLPKSPRGTFHIKAGQALLGSEARLISYETLEQYPVVVNANMGLGEVTAQWRRNALYQSLFTGVVAIALLALMLTARRQLRRSEETYRVLIQQQKEITASAETWQATFDAVEDAVWVMGLDRRVIKANKGTERMFGSRSSEIVGRLCCEVAHQDRNALATCPFAKMLETGHRASMQLELDGRWYEVSVDPVRNRDGEITGAVHIVSDITEIKKSEELAVENAARMRVLLSAIPNAIFFKDGEGRWLLANPAGVELFGLQEIDYIGITDLELAEMVPGFRLELQNCFHTDQAAWTNGDISYSEEIIHDGTGNLRTYDVLKVPIFRDDTSRRGIVVICRDVTEQRLMELQLRQAQKMEAIGHLAGGIAHDFNNLLTPILGYAEMLATRLPAGDPLTPKVNGISAAAHKAKDLTQQLLSFGRRQSIETSVVDLNEIIESFYIVLRRTIRESIDIDLKLDPAGAYVLADRSQMEQIILNMTVNAQDAMGSKGLIAIETCPVVMDGEEVRLHPGMVAGSYVLLSFKDNGCGMSEEVLSHIFEPFFTTKAAGHGTGLGLATVYGIVKQHNGFISVLSREGEGTTFRIYLPASAAQPLLKPAAVISENTRTPDSHTVLVVEDNEMVLNMVREMLEGYGYTVFAAADPAHAIQVASENRTRISLLVSDVVMPGMSGPELYEQLIAQMPDLKVVYISGYPMNPSIRGGTLEEEVSFLQKPFTAEALLERIQLVM